MKYPYTLHQTFLKVNTLPTIDFGAMTLTEVLMQILLTFPLKSFCSRILTWISWLNSSLVFFILQYLSVPCLS